MEMSIPDIESEYGIYPHSIAKSKYFYIINSGGKSYRLYVQKRRIRLPYAQNKGRFGVFGA